MCMKRNIENHQKSSDYRLSVYAIACFFMSFMRLIPNLTNI